MKFARIDMMKLGGKESMLKLGNGWVLSERVLDDEIGGESNGQ